MITFISILGFVRDHINYSYHVCNMEFHQFKHCRVQVRQADLGHWMPRGNLASGDLASCWEEHNVHTSGRYNQSGIARVNGVYKLTYTGWWLGTCFVHIIGDFIIRID